MNLENFPQYTATAHVPGSFTGQTQHACVTFDNSDLVNGTLVLNHLRNASLVIPEALFSATGELQDPAGIFQIIDQNTCKYTFSGDLEAGRYLFILKFLYL